MASTAALPKRAHRRTFSKKELLNHLKILGPITNPLPATLPPSPPPSRSASPAPERSTSSAKRKREEGESSLSPSSAVAKRPRPSPDVGAIPPQAPPTPPSEDSLSSHRSIPVKRPRRGRQPVEYNTINTKYTEQGRRFKHSAEARMQVYLRLNSALYVEIINKPPPDSPYAKMDRVMSKLESLDSVICFAYSQWFKEFHARRYELPWWQNATSYFDLAKTTFLEGFTDPGPREEALLGIHYLIDAYWRSRYANHLFHFTVKDGIKAAVNESQKSPLNHKTPPNTNPSTRSPSVNPSNGSGTTLQPTPPSTGLSPAANHASSNGSSGTPQSTVAPPSSPSISLSESLVRQTQIATDLYVRSSESLFMASTRLTLPILESHYPHTYARVAKSTLKSFEEWEIDFEDDESELFWPLAPTRGDGVGWVLALGRSMLREYGGPLGYKGIDGTIRPEDIIRPNRRP